MTISMSDQILEAKNDVVHIRASETGRLIGLPELLPYVDVLPTLAERDLWVRYE
jgi:hypothetical protein